jgi:hypothetical protein
MASPSERNAKHGGARAADSSGPGANSPRIERRLTVGLERSLQLAGMVARSRAARQVQAADMLAGMYIYEWERLSAFWSGHDAIEALLRRICSISPQRWNHWIELYDQQRRREQIEASSPWRRLMQRTRSSTANEKDAGGEDLPRSLELEKILRSAGDVSPFCDDVGGRAVPVLTSESVLLCLARDDQSELADSLCETGLDVAALERAARDPRRVPRR